MKITILFVIGALGLTGCADMFKYQPYAREVKRKSAEGGIIALNTTHRDEDRLLADTMMRRTCGALDTKIIEEGEVAVGTATSGSASTEKGEKSFMKLGGMKFDTSTNDTTSTSTQTTELREWRIQYECVKKK